MKRKFIFLSGSFALAIAVACAGLMLVRIASSPVKESSPGQIVVGGHRALGDAGIFSYDRKLNYLWRLTPRDMLAYSPAWSPDGSQIAFVYSDGPRTQFHLGILTASTGKVDAIPERGTADLLLDQRTSLAWSPDGQRLLFDLASSDSCRHLFIYQLEEKTYVPVNIKFCPLFKGDRVDHVDLSWSPNDSPLVGVSYLGHFNFLDDIYRLDPQLTQEDWITHGSSPMWRPGTRDFSFVRGNTGGELPNSIWLYSVENATTSVLVKNLAFGAYTWSPDGRYILDVDLGTKMNDPTYLLLIDVETGQRVTLLRLLEFSDHVPFIFPWISATVTWSAR